MSPSESLFDHFLVVGLPSSEALVTLEDEDGYHGIGERYMPGVVDALHAEVSACTSKLPPHLHICCLPGGVQIFPPGTPSEQLAPRVYSLVLTDETGGRLYTSVLCFTEEVPAFVVSRHSALMGCRASKAVALLCRHPYLTTMEQVLRTLYASVFCVGMSAAVGDAVTHLLRVPSPVRLNAQIDFELEGRPFSCSPPSAVAGLPLDELSLRPLLEALSVQNVLLLYLAVLLERRVLLRCSHYSLLTRVAEGIRQLLFPLRQPHVYIPVLPYALVDYLDAPTPFLMGLHPSVALDAGLLSQLVVVDLDSDQVANSQDLMGCLAHPAVVKLQHRLLQLLQPNICLGDSLRIVTDPANVDPWDVHLIRMSTAGWGPSSDHLVRRLFLQLQSHLLRGYSHHVKNERDSGSLGSPAKRSASFMPQIGFDSAAFLDIAIKTDGPAVRPLLEQLLQTLTFFAFLDEYGGQGSDPYSWYATGCQTFRWWLPHQGAEEPSQSSEKGSVDSHGTEVQSIPAVITPAVVRVARCPAALLQPSRPVVHRVFPPLFVSDEPPGGDIARPLHRFWGGFVRRRSSTYSRSKSLSGQLSESKHNRLHESFSSNDDAEARLLFKQDSAQASKLKRSSINHTGSGGGMAPSSNVDAFSNQRPPLNSYAVDADLLRKQLQALTQILNHGGADPGSTAGSEPDLRSNSNVGGSGIQNGSSSAYPVGLSSPFSAKAVVLPTMGRVQQGQVEGHTVVQNRSANGSGWLGVGAGSFTAKGAARAAGGNSESDTLKLCKQLLSIQTGANACFLVSKLCEEVNPWPHSPATLDYSGNSYIYSHILPTTASMQAQADRTQPDRTPAQADKPSEGLPIHGIPLQAGGGAGVGGGGSLARNSGSQARSCQRALSVAACEVLVELLEQVLLAAVRKEDFAMVLSTIEVAMCFYCHDGCGGKARVLHKLSRCPVLYTTWLWSGVFAAALSPSSRPTTTTTIPAAPDGSNSNGGLSSTLQLPFKSLPVNSSLLHMQPTRNAHTATNVARGIPAAALVDPNADLLPCGRLFSRVFIDNPPAPGSPSAVAAAATAAATAAAASALGQHRPSPPSALTTQNAAGACASPIRHKASFSPACSPSAPPAAAAAALTHKLQMQQKVLCMEAASLSLSNLAVYMMHVGLAEESCWLLLSRLAAQALTEHEDVPGAVQKLLAGLRVTLQRAKQCARTQHRTRMPVPERLIYMPSPPYTPPPQSATHPSTISHSKSTLNSPLKSSIHSSAGNPPISFTLKPSPFSAQHSAVNVPHSRQHAQQGVNPAIALVTSQSARLSSAGIGIGFRRQNSSSLADTYRPPFDTRMAMTGPSTRLASGTSKKQLDVSSPQLALQGEASATSLHQHQQPSPAAAAAAPASVTNVRVKRSDSTQIQDASRVNSITPARRGNEASRANSAGQLKTEARDPATVVVLVVAANSDQTTSEDASTAGATESSNHLETKAILPGTAGVLPVPQTPATTPKGSSSGRPATASAETDPAQPEVQGILRKPKSALPPKARLSSATLASRASSQTATHPPPSVGRVSSSGSVACSVASSVIAPMGWDPSPHGARPFPQPFSNVASVAAAAFIAAERSSSGAGGGGSGTGDGQLRPGLGPRARMVEGVASMQLTAGSAPVVALDAGNRVVVAAVQGGGLHLLRLQAGCLIPGTVVPLPMMSPGSSVGTILLSGDSTSAAVAGPMGSSSTTTPSSSSVLMHVSSGDVSQQQYGVVLLDVVNARVVSRLQPAQGGRVTKLCYSPAGSMILAASSDGTARLWDVRQRSARMTSACTIQSGQGGISSLMMDLSRSWVVTGGWDGSTCAWDLRKPSEPTVVYQSHQGWVTHLSLLHHGNRLRLLTASADWTAAVHDADTGAQECVMVGSNAPITALHALAEPGQVPEIITTSSDGSITVWNLHTGACLQHHKAHSSSICMLAKYDQNRWVTAAQDNTVRLWRGEDPHDHTTETGPIPFCLKPIAPRDPCTRAITPCSVLDVTAGVVVSGSTTGAVYAWNVKAQE